MRKLIIEGKNIYLREIQLSDVIDSYCDWLNDPLVNQYLESRFEKWSLKKTRAYLKQIKGNPDNVFLAIIARDKDKHIGNIKLGPINRHHKIADVGIIIGDKSFWGKGYATESVKLIVSYAFDVLRLHKLTAGAYANNISSAKVFKKAGFSVEGLRKKHCFYKGRYVDAVLFGVVRK